MGILAKIYENKLVTNYFLLVDYLNSRFVDERILPVSFRRTNFIKLIGLEMRQP